VPMDVLLGAERTRRSQVIKQADVVMLVALLPERYPRAAQETNYRYYEPRCGHGSSLSPAAHALVAARLGDAEGALRYFHQAAAIDLDDTIGTAAQGVHVATLGGLWQAAVLGFAGLGLAADGLRLAPCLPTSWRRLRFAVEWHGRRVRVEIEGESQTVTATLERGHPLALHLGEHHQRLRRGESWVGSWHELAESGAAERRVP
jgi:trehalose/maltose hydrolase-like predicted phosphorylase